MSRPISIVINTHPALNHHLSRCIASVAWQMNEGDELIVVSDGGPAEMHVEAVRMIGIEPGVGIAAARNRGIAEAKNEWIKFLDVDDLLCPFALNAFRQAMLNLKTAVVVGGQIAVHNGVVRAIRPPNEPYRVVDGMPLIKRINPTLVSMTFISKTAAQAVGGFDERIQFEEDWDFWLRIHTAQLYFNLIPEPVCFYWIDDAERKAKQRDHTVEGMDVREYFAMRYGVEPLKQ